MQHTVDLLHCCATGQKKIREELVKLAMGGFFESFDVSVPHDNCSSSVEFTKKFAVWMEEYFPPAVIETNIQSTIKFLGHNISRSFSFFLISGVENLGESDWVRFYTWTRQVSGHLKTFKDTPSSSREDLTASQEKILVRFSRTLKWFESQFIIKRSKYSNLVLESRRSSRLSRKNL